jgi:hypothetical protein
MEIGEFMIVGSYSQLVKIFLPEFWVTDEKTGKETRVKCTDMIKDPERIMKKEKIRFHIPRSVGAFNVTLNQPENIADKDLACYLTGDDIGQREDPEFVVSTETDCYGIASLAIKSDIQGMILQGLATGEASISEGDLKAQLKTAHENAVKISEHRCRRAAKKIVQGIKDQRQKDTEAGRGHFVPSPAEYLAAYFLAADETTDALAKKAVVDKFAGMMDQIEAKGAATLNR